METVDGVKKEIIWDTFETSSSEGELSLNRYPVLNSGLRKMSGLKKIKDLRDGDCAVNGERIGRGRTHREERSDCDA